MDDLWIKSWEESNLRMLGFQTDSACNWRLLNIGHVTALKVVEAAADWFTENSMESRHLSANH